MIHYNFPPITHIDQVLPHIEGDKTFGVFPRDGFTVIDYNFMSSESFPDVADENDINAKMRRECRGLIFNERGELISRRFHKFFNLDEREEIAVDKIDFSRPHKILEKLDGSMVSPCRIKGELKWITRMGVTFISDQVPSFIAEHPTYVEFAELAISLGYTAIFEWCSRKNRVVIDHPVDRLVLTAVRVNETGRYLDYESLHYLATVWDLELVKAIDSEHASKADMLAWVRAQEDQEGIVIRFDDGHMLKVKGEWYVRIHRAKSFITNERAVAEAIAHNSIDDVLATLPEEDRKMVEDFRDRLLAGMYDACAIFLVETKRVLVKYPTKKDYALSLDAAQHNQFQKNLIFTAMDGKVDVEFGGVLLNMFETFKKKATNNANYADLKKTFFLQNLEYRYNYNGDL